MVRSNSTINYYDNNAQEYFAMSVNTDMTDCYEEFLKHIPSHGSIIDIGCGSGRDLKYFIDHGYKAEGIDASERLCELAKKYSGCNVICTQVQNFTPESTYDGIWACASLLHLSQKEILELFKRLGLFFRDKGVLFLSMKTGIKTGFDPKGRYFTNWDPRTIQMIQRDFHYLKIEKHWITNDKLNRFDFQWENIIITYSSTF